MEEINQNIQSIVPQSVSQPQNTTSHSSETRTIVTVLLLIFIYPVGLVVMWVWAYWPKWLKWFISAPVIIGIVAIILGFVLIATLPHSPVNR